MYTARYEDEAENREMPMVVLYEISKRCVRETRNASQIGGGIASDGPQD